MLGFGKGKKSAVTEFKFPPPSHADRKVQAVINRVAYLLWAIEVNERHRAYLLRHESELREKKKQAVRGSSGSYLRDQMAYLTEQIKEAMDATAEMAATIAQQHGEMTELIDDLPDDVDTFTLYAARLEQL